MSTTSGIGTLLDTTSHRPSLAAARIAVELIPCTRASGISNMSILPRSAHSRTSSEVRKARSSAGETSPLRAQAIRESSRASKASIDEWRSGFGGW